VTEPTGRARRGWAGGRLAALAPRRRALVIATTLVILAGAGLGAALAASGGQASRPGGAGGSNPGGAARLPPQNRPGPVLLVPGYGGGTSSLDVLAARIRATGRTAIVLHLPGTGTGSLVTDAGLLNAAVNRTLARGARSVDIVGYSAGGVVVLIWARRDDGVAHARRIVTLGSPFHGTTLAGAAQALLPGACPVACQQLTPGSSLLKNLQRSQPGGLPPWLSLWTTDDDVVTPPDSARLRGAVDVPVQSVCRSVRVTHSQLPENPDVDAMVLQALGAGPLRRPTAADCR